MILEACVIIGIAVAAAGLEHLYRNRQIPDIDIPNAPGRKLWYGYYGRIGNQVAETKDHINLLWESQFEGIEKASASILEAKMNTVLDVHVQLFNDPANGKDFTLRIDAPAKLREAFDYLRGTGALSYVKILYPVDEPNTMVESPQDLLEAIRILKAVSLEYKELSGVKYAVIYAAKPASYTCYEEYDYIGINDYQFKSQIFINGTYQSIKDLGKQTFLVPGGAFGQDPKPFLNFANSNPEVVAIIPFVWFGPQINADNWIGIRDQEIRKQAYIETGKSIIETTQ